MDNTEESKALQFLPNGKFAPGNQVARGVKHTPKVWELKNAMMAAATPEVMAELTNRLIDLCRSDEPKTALAALEMFLNRILGKPKETIEMDVNATSPAALTLDADDLLALERMRRKLSSEPEVIVTPLPAGDE